MAVVSYNKLAVKNVLITSLRWADSEEEHIITED